MTQSPAGIGRSWLSGSVYGIVSWFAPVVLSLAVTPYIVKGLGPEQYGLYALVLGLIGYSFNLNVSRALTRYIAEALSSGDTERVRRLVGSGMLLAIVLGGIALLAIALLSDWYVGRIVEDASTSLLGTGLVIGGLTILILLLGQVFIAVLQGFQRLKLFSLTATITSAATLIANMLVVLTGGGFIEILWVSLAVVSLITVVNGVLALWLLGWKVPTSVDRESVSLIIGHSKYVIGYQLLGNFVLLLERTLIAKGLGTEALTHYVVPMMVGLNFAGFVNGLSLFVFPAVSAARGDSAIPLKIYRAVSQAVFLSCALALCATLAHSDLFLGLWISPEFSKEASVAFSIQMVGLCAVALSSVAFQVGEGLGLARINFLGTLIVSAATVLVMLVPLYSADIENFALARAIGFGIWIPLIAVIERKAFGSAQTKMWLDTLKRGLPGIVLFALFQYYSPGMLGFGWLGLIGSLAIGTLVCLGVLVKFGYFGEILSMFDGRNDDTTKASPEN